IQLAIRGPAVGDVEYCFRERWTEPRAVTRNPFYRLADLVRRDDDRPDPLPDQLPDPPRCGTQAVQVLRTYPYRRVGYRFAPRGGDRVAVFGLENRAGTPVYVHAKVCIVDDTWLAVGSDNINLRSWTHDSELGCAVLDLGDADGPDAGEAGGLARSVRLA